MKIKAIIFLIVIISGQHVFSQSAGKFYKEGKRAISYGKTDEAIDLFTKAIALEPEDKDYYIARAEQYEKKKEFQKAIDDYNKSLSIREDHDIFIHTADLNIRLHQYKEAVVLLNKIFARDKWDEDALERKAWCMIRLKDFNEAAHAGTNGIQNYSGNHLFYYYRAIAKDSLKDYVSACQDYDKAIKMIRELKVNSDKIAADYKPYFVNYAFALHNKQSHDESIKNYTIATTLDPADTVEPKNYRIYYMRSFPYLSLFDYNNVFIDLNKSIGMNQDDKETIFQRGIVNRKTSQFNNAINDFTKHLAIDEKSAEGYYQRGLCYLELGKFKECIADLKNAVLHSKDNKVYAAQLADAQQKQYEANREADAPEIKIEYPFIDGNGFINVLQNQITLIIRGKIKDKSLIEFIKINGVAAVYDPEEVNPEFRIQVDLKDDLRKIEVSVSDIYHNVSSKTVKVGHLVSDSKLKVNFAGNILSDDDSKSPYKNKQVYLVNENGEVFFVAKTDEHGRFKFENIPYDHPYFLTMDVSDSPLSVKQKFIITDKDNKTVLSSKEDGKNKFRFEILPSDYNTMTLMSVDDAPLMIDIKGRLIAGNESKSPIANLGVLLLNAKGELMARVKTDAFGAFLFSRLLPKETYSIQTDSAESQALTYNKILITDDKGALIKEVTRNSLGFFKYEMLQGDKVQLSAISAVDPWLKTMNLSKEKNEISIIENIYYTSNSSDILPEAEVVLNKAIEALKNNPKLTMEVQSHTDAVASDEYNMDLSQKRASTVINYMITKGIDKKRLTAKGFGETQLSNRCANDVECSDAEHKQNRRTVFKINYVGN
ncbi:MAG TPA: OmpA family protein [Bacteroidia bacterium]|jgi:outer membrane protein OmpA-like peptidoglycan-associated protein/tetratricopeptide (TPR) repeat protein